MELHDAINYLEAMIMKDKSIPFIFKTNLLRNLAEINTYLSYRPATKLKDTTNGTD